VASISLLYLIGRDLFNKQTGLVAAFIAAVAPFHLQYSQETRMYTLLALLLMGATWCYMRGMSKGMIHHAPTDEHSVGTDTPEQKKSGNWGWWIAFGVLAGLAMHTQYLAVFYLTAIGLVPLFKRDWRMVGRVMVGAVISLIVFLPWLVSLPEQLANLNANYWINRPTFATLLLSPGIFMGGYHEFGAMQVMMIYGGALFITALIVFQVMVYARRPRRKSESDIAQIGWVLWLFGAPIIFMWLFSQIVPVYLERALIGSVMMLYLILAWVFTRSGMPRPIKALLLLIIAVVFLLGDIAQYQVNSFPYVPVKGTMAYIRDNLQAGDVVLHMNKLTVLPAEVYAPDIEQRFLADSAGSTEDTLDPSTQAVLGVQESGCIQAATQGASRVWFITLAPAEQEYAVSGRTELQDAFGWLGTYYTAGDTVNFNDLNIYLYIDGSEDKPTDCDE
jgi:uncharacterized membrane protein